MLTLEKVNIYKKYGGLIDGYLMQSKNPLERIITSEEWHLIDNILLNTLRSKNENVSQEIIDNYSQSLKSYCDSEDTIKELMGLGEYLKNQKHRADTFMIPIIEFIIQNDIIDFSPVYANWHIGYTRNIKFENKARFMYWNWRSIDQAELTIKHFTNLGMNEVKFVGNGQISDKIGYVFIYYKF